MKKCILLLLLPISIHPLQKIVLTEPVVPTRLFTVPSAEVMHSFDIILTGQSSLDVHDQKLFSTFVIGLGDIAEVEVGYDGMLSGLKTGKIVSIPASMYKLRILNENGKAVIPVKSAFDCAMMVRKSFWSSHYENGILYNSRYGKLFLTISKRLQNLFFIFGLLYMDVRVKYNGSNEISKSIKSFYTGMELLINKRTRFITEVSPTLEAQYSPTMTSKDISNVWSFITGVRWSPFNAVALDAAVKIDSDRPYPGDFIMWLGINLAIPIHKIYRSK